MTYLQQHKQCVSDGTAVRGPGKLEAVYLCKGKSVCTMMTCSRAQK